MKASKTAPAFWIPTLSSPSSVEDLQAALAQFAEWSSRDASDIEHVANEGMERLGKAT
jgi:hypothetical protein